MAQIPTKGQVALHQMQTSQEIADKIESQELEGKEFIVDRTGHGPGVIPEDVWKNLPGVYNG